MSKITLTGFALLSVLFFGYSSENYATQPQHNASDASTGTLQKMIVENGSVTVNVDLNGLNGSDALITRPVALQFAAATNSFFSILVFNDQLRGPESGSIALIPQGRPVSLLPALFAASFKQLVVEKLPADSESDIVVRDAKTGFTFFKSACVSTPGIGSACTAFKIASAIGPRCNAAGPSLASARKVAAYSGFFRT